MHIPESEQLQYTFYDELNDQALLCSSLCNMELPFFGTMKARIEPTEIEDRENMKEQYTYYKNKGFKNKNTKLTK